MRTCAAAEAYSPLRDTAKPSESRVMPRELVRGMSLLHPHMSTVRSDHERGKGHRLSATQVSVLFETAGNILMLDSQLA